MRLGKPLPPLVYVVAKVLACKARKCREYVFVLDLSLLGRGCSAPQADTAIADTGVEATGVACRQHGLG